MKKISILATVLALGAFACGGSDTPEAAEPAPPATETAPPAEGTELPAEEAPMEDPAGTEMPAEGAEGEEASEEEGMEGEEDL